MESDRLWMSAVNIRLISMAIRAAQSTIINWSKRMKIFAPRKERKN